MNDCKELCQQIQSAIEQGQLTLWQFTMKVDSQPFPDVNMVECVDQVFSFGINMVGPARHRDAQKGKAGLGDRPQKDEKE
jgi:hypothetical protein